MMTQVHTRQREIDNDIIEKSVDEDLSRERRIRMNQEIDDKERICQKKSNLVGMFRY